MSIYDNQSLLKYVVYGRLQTPPLNPNRQKNTQNIFCFSLGSLLFFIIFALKTKILYWI